MKNAGTAAMPIITRHGKCSLAPTRVETTMPTPIPTWKVSTSLPRCLAGASSATYIGTICVAPPTANPSRTRLADRVTGLGETEQASAPTT